MCMILLLIFEYMFILDKQTIRISVRMVLPSSNKLSNIPYFLTKYE